VSSIVLLLVAASDCFGAVFSAPGLATLIAESLLRCLPQCDAAADPPVIFVSTAPGMGAIVLIVCRSCCRWFRSSAST
jgi:hypothetical protein